VLLTGATGFLGAFLLDQLLRRPDGPGVVCLVRAHDAGVGLRRIRENLALALAYNAIAVPLAIAGVLGPFSAALAMSASSLVVTGNALRLRRFGRPT